MRESAGRLTLLRATLMYAGASETTVQEVDGATVRLLLWSKDAINASGRGTRELQVQEKAIQFRCHAKADERPWLEHLARPLRLWSGQLARLVRSDPRPAAEPNAFSPCPSN